MSFKAICIQTSIEPQSPQECKVMVDNNLKISVPRWQG